MLRKALYLSIALLLCKAASASTIVNPPTTALATLPLPAGATNYIQSSNTLQSGATFYLSSGTVTNLNASTITVNNIGGTFIGMGRNKLLNGDMQFDQNHESNDSNLNVYITTNNFAHYTLDQWRGEDTNATSQYTVLRSTQNLGLGGAGPSSFFQNAMLVTVTTAAPVGSSDGVNMEYPFEGYDIRDLAWGTSYAQPVTLQFWVRSSSAGYYSVTVLQNNASTRTYVSTYTITAANTWYHIVETIPGDTTPPETNWPTGAMTFGLKIVWDLGSGSAVVTSSINQWLTSNAWKAAGSNSLTTGFNTWEMTGVQFEIGPQPTAFEYLPYGVELARLQRYLFKTLSTPYPCSSGQGTQGALEYVAQQPGLTAGGGTELVFPTSMSGQGLSASQILFLNPIVGGGSPTWWNVTQGAVSGTATAPNAAINNSSIFVYNPQVSTDHAGDLMAIHVCVSQQTGGI